jgi:hypothetical protein
MSVIGVAILLGVSLFGPSLKAEERHIEVISRLSEEEMYTGTVPGAPELKVIHIWDKTNVDQIKDLLTDSYYYKVKNWGLRIKEVEHIPWFRPKKVEEATRKYSHLCRLDPEGNLSGYVAGIPFPDPKTGTEAIWNLNLHYFWGDCLLIYPTKIFLVDRRGGVRMIKYIRRDMKWAGRCELFPILKPEENPDEISWKMKTGEYYPSEINGLCDIIIRYNTAKLHDHWMYIPSIRRIRRLSTAQMQDSWAGTDFVFDDVEGFYGKVPLFTFKLLGKREMLMPAHQIEGLEEHIVLTEGPMYQDITLERTAVWVIQMRSKDPNYIYSNKIVYIDPATGMFFVTDCWDRKGRFWKESMYAYDYFPDERGYGRWCFMDCTDYQARHATFCTRGECFSCVLGTVKEEDFELSNIKRLVH